MNTAIPLPPLTLSVCAMVEQSLGGTASLLSRLCNHAQTDHTR